MYLKRHVYDVALRIELLAILHLRYWRWSTMAFLREVAARLAEYTQAQPLARAAILVEAWDIMSGVMEPMQVVSTKGTFTLALQRRDDIHKLRG